MITELELKCFRRHRDLKLTFTPGLNALRGPNESGKTTITEAILYVLFGSKLLRDTLAETVTWEHKETELKVRAVFVIDNGIFTFTRSKSGAECNYERTNGGEVDTGKVVGQNEVSAFAANLLGADAKVTGLLMMASQNGLRGALDEGPPAVSRFMGKLADFDMIDKIIENASQRLTLGSTLPLTAKLTDAQAEVVACEEALKVEDNSAALTEIIEKLTAERTSLSEQEGALQIAVADADTAVQKALTLRQSKESAVSMLLGVNTRLESAKRDLAAAQVKAADKPDAVRTQELTKLLADAAEGDTALKAYMKFKALPAYPGMCWDQDKVSFEAERSRLRTVVAELTGNKVALEGEVRSLESKKITSGKCPTCGHAANSDEHVAQHNADIQKSIDSLKLQLNTKLKEISGVNSDLKDLDEVQRLAAPFEALAVAIPQYIDVKTSMYPPHISWRGPVPAAPENLQGLRTELASLQAKQTACVQAEGQVLSLSSLVATTEREAKDAAAFAQSIVVPNIDELKAKYEEAYRKLADLTSSINQLRTEIEQHRINRDHLIAVRKQAEDKLVAAKARVVEYQMDLTKLEFNNALIAKLKKLKPQITDYLWNNVLAAVGNFFSTMRGETSVVTKDANGFKVNGRSIDSLSGSTLDILALAVRVALTKTFIPHASFLCLDEPAHGCDALRTGNVLGFLSSVGFTQTLLASHDELSEAVADNVVALGD